MAEAVELESLVTCPVCGDQRVQVMPEVSCLLAYTCPACGEVLRPGEGDCCIFCTYGSVPCPVIQAQRLDDGGTAQTSSQPECCGDANVSGTPPPLECHSEPSGEESRRPGSPTHLTTSRIRGTEPGHH